MTKSLMHDITYIQQETVNKCKMVARKNNDDYVEDFRDGFGIVNSFLHIQPTNRILYGNFKKNGRRRTNN